MDDLNQNDGNNNPFFKNSFTGNESEISIRKYIKVIIFDKFKM